MDSVDVGQLEVMLAGVVSVGTAPVVSVAVLVGSVFTAGVEETV
jgi:hypothetical protein